MTMPQIQNLSHRHDAILDYLMANPLASQGEVALAFNVTQAWLSVVMNSDVFRAKQKARGDEYFQGSVVPLRDKVVGAASMAMDRVMEKLEDQDINADYALKAADQMLNRLGYAPVRGASSQAPVQIQQNYSVPPDVLQKARESFGSSSTSSKPRAIELERSVDENTILSPSQEIQAGGECGMGEALQNPAPFHQGNEAEGQAQEGAYLPASSDGGP